MLDQAHRFEEAAAERYAAIRDLSSDNGVRLLTYWLARHRRHMDQALADLSASEVDRLRRIELKHAVHVDSGLIPGVLGIPPGTAHGNHLLTAAIQYDSELIRFYRDILSQELIAEARQLVEALIRIEERDVVMLKKMLAMDYF
jgi:hypothetical protein